MHLTFNLRESTAVVNNALPVHFVRKGTEVELQKKLLFCKLTEANTTGEDSILYFSSYTTRL